MDLPRQVIPGSDYMISPVAAPSGAFRLTGRATLDGRPVEETATLVVCPEGRELADVVAHASVLREIAKASKGEFREGKLGNPSVRAPRKVRAGSLRTIEIWSHPAKGARVASLGRRTSWLQSMNGYGRRSSPNWKPTR